MADTALNVSFLKGTQSKLNGLTQKQYIEKVTKENNKFIR